MISVKNISKQFNNFYAVKNVSFDSPDCGILGLLGPNGAGKSTTMRMITGYFPPDNGMITINGIDVEKDPIKTKGMIGYLPETSPLYKDMTVKSFLKFSALIREVEKVKYSVDRVISICNLEKVVNRLVDTLSKGFYQRVCLAQSIIHDPACLILDEPTDGLDPIQKREVTQLIKDMGRSKSILISTHMLDEVEDYCSDVVIISEGEVVTKGTIEEMKNKSGYANTFILDTDKSEKEKIELFIRDKQDLFKTIEINEREKSLNCRFFPIDNETISDSMHIISHFIDEKNIKIQNFRLDKGSLEKLFSDVTVSNRIQKKRRQL